MLENTVGRLWRTLGRWLNALTGKSSFTVARGVTVAGSMIYLVLAVIAKDWASNIVILHVLQFGIFVLFVSLPTWKAIRRLEQAMTAPLDVLGREFTSTLLYADAFTGGGLLLLPLGFVSAWFGAYAVGSIICGGALFIATEYRGTRVSSPMRAAGWLKSRISRIGTHAPTPYPTPT